MQKKAPLTKSVVRPRPLSQYDEMFLEMVQGYGGFSNGHAHIDRAYTLPSEYLEDSGLTTWAAAVKPLVVKQKSVGYLHEGPAYKAEDLRPRMAKVIQHLIDCGTTHLDTCIDASLDFGSAEDNGQLAINVANELKAKFAKKIVIRTGPMPIFGFKEGTGRWEAFEAAAHISDFLVALAEKDTIGNVRKRDGRVGFRKHLQMVLDLGCKLQKEVHLHLDQANDPNENGTETLVDGLRSIEGLKLFSQPQIPGQKDPTVWVVHMISPSAYDEARFRKLIDALLEFNIGVIVCPSAGISMRQLRPVVAPEHNSIARMLELCAMRVPIRIGTDNICDMFVPQCGGDMLSEAIFGGHALRFAMPRVWAKLACGIQLNDVDRDEIIETLKRDNEVFRTIDPNWKSAILL